MSNDHTDLEIIYELHWKNDIGNGSDMNKINIMGILDTPDTCADWNTFKSYLMQNSGTSEDICVAYVDCDGEEILISSDNYQSALEYSRDKARKGEKVILTLEKPKCMKKHLKMSKHKHGKYGKIGNGGKHHHNFCTKSHFPNPFFYITDFTESSEEDDEQPPLWFLKYMKKFKQEVRDIIVESVYYMTINGHCYQQKLAESKPVDDKLVEKKKSKKKVSEEDSSDTCLEGCSLEDRYFRRMQKIEARERKIERIYETKIGKLENKVKRIIDKNCKATKSHSHTHSSKIHKKRPEVVKHSEMPPPTNQSSQMTVAERSMKKSSAVVVKAPPCDDPTSRNVPSKITNHVCCENYMPQEVFTMNAMPLNRQMVTGIACRGEIITQRWEVMNNGLSPWTDETELRFTWGSSTLVPLTKVVKVPKLKPGETGIIEIQMQAPDAVGRFESYWYFYHSGIRFGHWLGCAYVIGNEKGPYMHINTSYPMDLTTKCQHYAMSEQKMSSTYATTDDMKISKSNPLLFVSATSSEVSDAEIKIPKPEKYMAEFLQNKNIQDTSKSIQFECQAATKDFNGKKLNDMLDNDENGERTEENEVNEDCDSDSDNISVISGTVSVGSTDHGEEFVMIPMPTHSPDDKKDSTPELMTFDTPTTSSSQSTNSIVDANDDNNNVETDQPKMNEDEKVEDKLPNDTKLENTMKIPVEKPKHHFTVVGEKTDDKQSEKPTGFTGDDVKEPAEQSINYSAPLYPELAEFRYEHDSKATKLPFHSYASYKKLCSTLGSSMSNNDTTTSQKKSNENLTTDSAHVDLPYPGANRSCSGHHFANDVNTYPYPGYMSHTSNCNHQNHVSDSSTSTGFNTMCNRRFVFTKTGTGFETYVDKLSDNKISSSEDKCEVSTEPRTPSRYSYVYNNGDGKPISTADDNTAKAGDTSAKQQTNQESQSSNLSDNKNTVHILPETFVNGAIQAASNAFNMACNAYDIIRGTAEENDIFAFPPKANSSSNSPKTQSTTNNSQRSSSAPNDGNSRRSEPSGLRSLDNCLLILNEMGFCNRPLNIKLLKRYNYDLPTVISKLV